MTVTELIAELRRLAAEGWGDALVNVRTPETETHYADDRLIQGVQAQPEYVNQPHVLID